METTNLSQTNIQIRKTLLPSDHSLRSVAEFNRLFRCNKKFHDFAKQVYSYLDAMKPGRVLRLNKYSGEKLEWIVRTACAFICEGNHWIDFEFSSDYMAVHRIAFSKSEKQLFRQMLSSKTRNTNPRWTRYYYNMNYTYTPKPYTTINQRTKVDK